LALAVAAAGTMVTAVVVSSRDATAAGPDFTLSGSVEGLFPGRTVDLGVTVQNPQSLRLTVNTADVSVGDASTACLAANLSAQGFAGSVTVGPHGTTTIPVELQLLDTAPDGCQGAAFPLTFHATGSRDASSPNPSGPFGSLPFTGLGLAASLMAIVGLAALVLGLAILAAARAGNGRRKVP
jgi:hypothetical protein